MNRKSDLLRHVTLAIVALLTATVAHADPPFVTGFDRFGRHAEIPPAAAGRLLLTELSCTACHAAKSPDLEPKRGPRLNGIAGRTRSEWLAKYLTAPGELKPGTTMPDVLAGYSPAEKAEIVPALVAFLSAQHEPFPTIKASGAKPVPFEFWNKGRIPSGRDLYHRVGCVACHEPDPTYETVETKPSPIDQLIEQLDPDELKELGLLAAARPVNSVPHGDLPAKYTPKSLTFFLLDPERTRPAGRMPNLKLSAMEAADVAAYLLRDQLPAEAAAATTPDDKLIATGARLFVELRCANCHTAKGVGKPQPAKPLAELQLDASQTCLSKPAHGLPHYELDEAQTSAVTATLTGKAAAAPLSPGENVRFRMQQLNCYACHERDKQGGVGRNRKRFFETANHIDLGDEGRIPPPLTGVGGKLTTAWFKKVLKGDGDVRPHLVARMPKFPSTRVAPLPDLFARADGASKESERQVFGNVGKLTEPGRMLLDTGCVQCHPLRGEALPGVIGVDLEGITARVQPRWFHDFLYNPIDLKPNTRMPTFFPNGKSSNKEVLGGNVDRQIAAIWVYLKGLDKNPLPDKVQLARSQDFELKPVDRPLMLRTFMKVAGTQAIAVGFPAKVHFAFDAEAVRPAQVWRGRFIDAEGTWFERAAPPAIPLGDDVIELPPGVPLQWLKSDKQPWTTDTGIVAGYRFGGYQLDRRRIPTFLYRYGKLQITDRIEPNGQNGLKRTLKLTIENPDDVNTALYFRAHAAASLKRLSPTQYAADNGLTVSLTTLPAERSQMRTVGELTEWIVPIDVTANHATIEVQYEW